MDQKQIDRINELARKAKTPEGLTEWEEQERPPCAGNISIPYWGTCRASWTTPTWWMSRATSTS